MLSTQFCPTCGASNEAAQTHCFACGHTLSTSTVAPAASDAPLLHERYQLGTVLGSGGFSTVYRAHDVQAGREVAIKQINLQGLSAEEAIEATDTFNREASVLSSLRHPQIPQFYDQFNDQDHWYLVLQYLEGPTLETYLETRTAQGKPLQFDEVLGMALQLAEVLNYLHTRQPPIIFRDLKPSNIMRTPPKGTLCLVDFGIARRFRAGQKRDTQALGSPGYAAPEQYGRAQTTPRSDIYSLGALLHFLLSGDDPAEEMSSGLKPLHLHAEKGAQAVSELVQHMLSPDPELRPASMHEVITALEDIQQQRTAQPTAHVWQPPVPQDPPLSWAGWRQVQGQTLVSPPPSAAQKPASRRRGPGRRKVLIGLGGALAAIGVGGTAWWIYPHLINHTSISPAQSQALYTYSGHTGPVTSIGWSPDGVIIASGSEDTTVQVWDSTRGSIGVTYREHTASVNAVVWSPDGQYIASGSNDNEVLVRDITTGPVSLTYLGHTASVRSIAWSPDSKRIASGVNDGTVQVWEVLSAKKLLTYQGHTSAVNAVAWSPDGQYIASGSNDNTVQVWEASTGKTILTYQDHIGYVTSVAWSPGSQYIASGAGDNIVQVWEAVTGNTILTYRGHTDAVNAVAWSPNAEYIASGSSDDTVRVWDTNTGETVSIYRGTGGVNAVAWSPDGQYIASGSSDKTAQVWDTP